MAWRESFWLKCKVRLSEGYPFRHRLRRCHTPPFVAARHLPPERGKSSLKGTAFGGGDKVSGIAQRRPLGGAGEHSETEGVSTETPPVCCADSPLWDGAFGMAGEFLAKAQSFRERQRLPLRGSWQNRQVLTEGVRFLPCSTWNIHFSAAAVGMRTVYSM